jgi:predicted ATP-dependent protease
MSLPRALGEDDVRVRTSPEVLPETPAIVSDRLLLLEPHVQRALLRGVRASDPTFHVFVAAEPHLQIEDDVLRAVIRTRGPTALAPDLLYVDDPTTEDSPVPLLLPTGRGEAFVTAATAAFRAARTRLRGVPLEREVRDADRHLSRTLHETTRDTLRGLEEIIKPLGFGVRTVPMGLETFPILLGKPVSREQFDTLDETTRTRLSKAEDELAPAIDHAARKLREANEAAEKERSSVTRTVAAGIVREELTALLADYADVPDALAWLEQVAASLIDSPPSMPGDEPAPLPAAEVLVTHAGAPAPPVLFETNPTAERLFGSIVRHAEDGLLVSGLEDLRPGALLETAGGFLVLRLEDLLRGVAIEPTLFDRLKLALRTREQEFCRGPLSAFPASATLTPLPAPLDVRVVLVGSDDLFGTLIATDPDFAALFRVKVEIDDLLVRNDDAIRGLDGFLMGVAVERNLLPFDREARARLIDVATRIAEDRERLSLAFAPLEDLLIFAHDLAEEADEKIVTRAHVETAFRERAERSSGLERHLREQILRGDVLLDTSGEKVGVVNGLAVVRAGDSECGQPMRITAVVALGNEGLIDVERDAQLGGAIHTKGVAILRGLLARIFGQDRTLSLRAQIVFEQSYGEVDGDSASSTELFAIVSALADVGVKQGIGVTGSINQLGDLQPIGGVCAKVEAFFDLCVARGLTGDQGVLLPLTNARHLVLRDDIADAVRDGTFHIHAAANVWEGLEILLAVPAGIRDSDERFPAESLFGRVERRLVDLAERLRRSEGGPPRDLDLGMMGGPGGVDMSTRWR